jgi:hypothetical protein
MCSRRRCTREMKDSIARMISSTVNHIAITFTKRTPRTCIARGTSRANISAPITNTVRHALYILKEGTLVSESARFSRAFSMRVWKLDNRTELRPHTSTNITVQVTSRIHAAEELEMTLAEILSPKFIQFGPREPRSRTSSLRESIRNPRYLLAVIELARTESRSALTENCFTVIDMIYTSTERTADMSGKAGLLYTSKSKEDSR